MRRFWIAVSGLFLLTGCGDDPVDVGTGTLEVTATTTGESVDADGYSILIDSADSGTVDANATASLEVLAGSYSVELGELDEPCAVTSDSPVTATVVEAGTTSVEFEVSC